MGRIHCWERTDSEIVSSFSVKGLTVVECIANSSFPVAVDVERDLSEYICLKYTTISLSQNPRSEEDWRSYDGSCTSD